jgi:enoyl-CoA hydratase/carnithine racemase
MIRTEVDSEGIALIINDRPERLNALDSEAYEQLSAAWTRVRDDDTINAAVITGAGERSFCAGADIKSYFSEPEPLSGFWNTQRGQLLNSGLEIWKPVVAAVNGHCLGGGMTLLLATDIRIASENATFAVTEVKRGLVPGNGGTQRILEQLPYPIAMELLLTGKTVDADTALRYGLINRVVPQADLLDTAFEVVREVLANAPLAVRAAKELAVRARDMDRVTGLRMEKVVNRLLWTSPDVREGQAAFTERRAAAFGRQT